ncbi:exonuclease domain-containing protein [Vibrio harveyi]|uniref:exonuclease domain-containing protein n=1 Tax=Vibrio harveyi TaxID=669 RepID=UPI003CF7A7E1
MNLKRILIFDLEMCCWDNASGRESNTGEIIEIGICEVDTISLEITRSAQYYVKPETDEVSAFCTELTGITPNRIKKQGRPLVEVLNTISKKFGSSNKTFMAWGRDDQVLKNEIESKNIAFDIGEYVNLANLYRLLYAHDKKCSQVAAMEEMGLTFEGRQHSGLVDAQNLASLYIEMTKKQRC